MRDLHRSQEFEVFIHLEGTEYKAEEMIGADT
jgi:hypothetical protein